MKSYFGKLIAANPMNPAGPWDKAVIMITAHTEQMAIGLQINQPLLELTMQSVCSQMNIYFASDQLVYYGGNMNPNKIHIIHSNDWSSSSTIMLNEHLSLTNDVSVLAALGQDQGPQYFRACAGFWAWPRGSLDQQLKGLDQSEYSWEVAPADLTTVFESGDYDHCWRNTLQAAVKEQISLLF